MAVFLYLSLILPFCLSLATVRNSAATGSTAASTASGTVVNQPSGSAAGSTITSYSAATSTEAPDVPSSQKNGVECYSTQSGKLFCGGACVVKIYLHQGGDIHTEVGCQYPQNATNRNTKNKCEMTSDASPRLLRYTAKIQNAKKWKMYNQGFFAVTKGDEIAVYKKCCFTKDCNLPSAFEEEIQGLRRAKLEEADPRRTDTDVISSLVIIVIALLVVYSVYKAWISFEKEKERSPDYLQELNPDLVQAAFQNGIEHGPEMRGELSLKENAAVLMVMMFPPKQESQSTSSSDTRVAILPPRVMQAAGNGHTLVKTIRSRPFFLQSILFRMLEHGPYYFPFRPMELLDLFDEAMEVFQAQRSLVFVSSCAIIGDLRGSYSDLCRWLQAVGWPPKTRLLFLGNVLDQDEPGSLETIALIAALKIAFPTEVYLLRGQTETFPFKPEGRFPARTGSAIGRCIMRMCSFLPTAAIVMERILAVPSGITPLVAGTKDLLDLHRPATLETLSDTQRHLLFNQPSPTVRMYRKNKNSRGDFFGSAALERIRSDLSVNMIVRGGAPVPEGYCPCWDHTLVSLWSTASKGTEKGAILLVSPKLEVTPVKMLRQTAPITSANTGPPGESIGTTTKAGSPSPPNSVSGPIPSGKSKSQSN